MAELLKDYDGPKYVRSEVMIPVRDGVTLHTIILRPEGSEKSGPPLPFLLSRTPYGVAGSSPESVEASKSELAASGYIFVFQDIRGRYTSGGQFVMNRPIVAHTAKSDVDETTDTHDTIDWLLKNVPNNSAKVGVLGVSYPGFLAIMAGIDAHPAVKAISPQAPMTDIWLGDDFFHNGAFRETYGFDYVQQLEAQKTDIPQSSKEDQYNFFLSHVNFAGAAAAAGMTNLPTAQRFLNEPTYTKFWQDMAVQRHLSKPEVPTLEVGGYWDQEDMWGPQAEYAALRPNEDPSDPNHRVFLVLGPWNHGAWGFGPGDSLGGANGRITFGGEKTGAFYRVAFEAPFFELYLKGKPGFDLRDTASFRTGENKWHRYDAWPPKQGFHTAPLYLGANHQLSLQSPSGDAEAASYIADPANPLPYRQRPIQSTYGQGSQWRTWLVEDQNFIADRKDLAIFQTPVLASDLTVTGEVVADLYAATTGTDADWIVKLIDVYPDGKYQLMVAEEIFRGRYRNGFTDPQPIKPGEVTEYKWSLHAADHTFLKGHRLMVEVQSSWFPLYDRNPQTWVPNIMTAPASAYKAQSISIYGSSRYPSHLDLPLAEGSTLP
ncbi:MAG TPA: CocE/NonD family hydrolase [Acidobacteriaceae bacterium]|nr:CocE/NonD family hydrolase [Acidobacteriaceae bacterium]